MYVSEVLRYLALSTIIATLLNNFQDCNCYCKEIHQNTQKQMISAIVQKIEYIVQNFPNKLSNADKNNLLAVVRNPSTSIPMLQFVIDSADNLIYDNELSDSELMEEYFFNQLKTVGSINKDVFSKYILQIESNLSSKNLKKYLNKKRADDPDDIMKLFVIWALLLENRVQLVTYENFGELDDTFLTAKSQWQIRKRIEEHTSFSPDDLSNANFSSNTLMEIRKFITIACSYKSLNISTVYGLCDINDDHLSSAAIVLIGEITSRLIFVEYKKTMEDIKTDYIKRKLRLLNKTLELEKNVDRLTENSPPRKLDKKRRSIHSNNARSELKSMIKNKSKILNLALSMANAPKETFDFFSPIEGLLENNSTSTEMLIFINNTLDSAIKNSTDFFKNYEEMKQEYMFERINNVGILEKNEFDEIMALDDDALQKNLEENIISKPEHMKTFTMDWKFRLNNVVKEKPNENFFKIAEPLFNTVLERRLQRMQKN